MSILDLVSSMGVDTGGRPVAMTHGGEWAMACPKCGGEDRFRVWPDQGRDGTWYCRGCDAGGDQIQLLRHVKGLSYPEACRALGLAVKANSRAIPRLYDRQAARPFEGEDAPLPNETWREHAGKLLAEAQEALAGNGAIRAYLRDVRGIGEMHQKFLGLGWVWGERERPCRYRSRKGWGLPDVDMGPEKGPKTRLWIPQGVLIPSFHGGTLTGLRVRIMEEDRPALSYFTRPYKVIDGSRPVPMAARVTNGFMSYEYRPRIFLADPKIFVVVESGLDVGLIASQWYSVLNVSVVGLMSATAKPDRILHASLRSARLILVALDYDDPGAKASQWWTRTYKNAVVWPVPAGKDPGEYFQGGGDVCAWIMAGINGTLKLDVAGM